ncbi:MAG: hypothetical protein K0Q94_2336, partial [Paenibacillus sp.]|nr:hypothetical protein [Paenibacillus sp.]
GIGIGIGPAEIGATGIGAAIGLNPVCFGIYSIIAPPLCPAIYISLWGSTYPEHG